MVLDMCMFYAVVLIIGAKGLIFLYLGINLRCLALVSILQVIGVYNIKE